MVCVCGGGGGEPGRGGGGWTGSSPPLAWSEAPVHSIATCVHSFTI